MKNSVRNLLILILIAVGQLLLTPVAQAQDEVGDFIRAGKSDANKLIKAYLDPAGKAFGHGLNSGWFNSGKAMKPGRFDIRIFGTVVFTPDDAKSFDLKSLDLERIRFDPNKPTMSPTIFGEDRNGPELIVYAEHPVLGEEEAASFEAPPGSGFDILPLPMAQLSIGLVKETEIAIRFIPTQKYDEFKGNLWGVGIKHGIKQWIPVLSETPGFDITVFGGYTNFESSYGIDVPLTADNEQYATPQQRASGYYDGQLIGLKSKALTATLVVSKTISVITGYAGVRYSNVQTDFTAEGKYPVVAYRTTAPYNKYVEDLESPIDVSMKDSQVGLNAGFRLKLAFFSLYAEGTYAKYPTASAGIGLGWN